MALDLLNSEKMDSGFIADEFSNAIGKKKKVKKTKKKKVKKVFKKLKDKVGKTGKNFRNKFRKIVRQGILFNLKKNIHGMSTRLYPAVAPESSLKKYKKSYIAKVKKLYPELLKKWTNLGGKEKDLKDAILEGSKRRFLRGKISFDASSNNDVYAEFYETYRSFLYDENLSNAEGDEESDVDEIPDEEETKKSTRGFFAWLRRLFKKEDALENPYESGTSESSEFSEDEKADEANVPSDSEAGEIDELEKTSKEDDAGGESDEESDTDDDKIFGINKTYFWIGFGLIALLGGILVYKKLKK